MGEEGKLEIQTSWNLKPIDLNYEPKEYETITLDITWEIPDLYKEQEKDDYGGIWYLAVRSSKNVFVRLSEDGSNKLIGNRSRKIIAKFRDEKYADEFIRNHIDDFL